ncbi:putative lipase atg15 [Phlyctochytrium bullatum]|nr:putative lipase atg15 [Phlyctochytrium bullatum]
MAGGTRLAATATLFLLLFALALALATATAPPPLPHPSRTPLTLRHLFRMGHNPPSHPSRLYFEQTALKHTHTPRTWVPDPDLLLAATGLDEPSLLRRLGVASLAELRGLWHAEALARRNGTPANVPMPPSPDFNVGVRPRVGKVALWSTYSRRAATVRRQREERERQRRRTPRRGQQPLAADEDDEALAWWEALLGAPHASGIRGNGNATEETETFSLPALGGDVSVAMRDVVLPDQTDKETVLAMGQMAFNAYYEPTDANWREVPGWGPSAAFGSQGSGIKGHVYASHSSDVVVIVIKGTDMNGATSSQDKLNDNKMFSCCCGKAGWSWTPVCGCADRSATTCDVECVNRESDFRESYFRMASTIAQTVKELFPTSSIWVTGHSLGGALAALVALALNLPAITFETPGDLLFAKRLGLLPDVPPVPRAAAGRVADVFPDGDLSPYSPYLDTLPIYQFGNDGDPVYMGDCRSVTSSCWVGGYAIETHCHIGKECLYEQDTDGKTPPPPESSTPPPRLPSPDGGRRRRPRRSIVDDNEDGEVGATKTSSINYHGIQYVIDRYLKPWEYVPTCSVNRVHGVPGGGCVDCENWKWA